MIDSDNFNQAGHENPKTTFYEDKSVQVEHVKVGAFSLSNEQISHVATNGVVALDANNEIGSFKISGGYLINSEEMDKSQIGDVRITWKYNTWTTASVLAVQKGESFETYTSKDGVKTNRVEEGEKTSADFISEINSENKFMKWLFRGIGALLIVFGYASVISPLTKLSSLVPVLGNIVGSLLGLIAFLIGIVHSLIIIVIAWFRYRPVLAIILLVVIAVIIVTVIKLVTSKKKEAPATANV